MQAAAEPIGTTTEALAEPTASPSPAPAAAVKGQWRLLAFAAASGGMLYLCHFPVAWGWLAWVALVPLLALTRAVARGRWLFLTAWICGLIYYWSAVSWMSVAGIEMAGCWAVLSTYCALYFPLTIYLVRRFDQRLGWPVPLTTPVVWTALEYFRSWFGTGFSWYLLGHTQHDWLAIVQIADLGGAALVTFLIVAVNVTIFEGFCRLKAVRGLLGLTSQPPLCCPYAYAVHVGAVTVLVTATLIYGQWRLAQEDFETGPRLALLQANLDQRLRIAATRTPEAQAKVRAAYRDLCLQAAKLQPRPDLIVWPETSFPTPWVAVAATIDLAQQKQEFRDMLATEQAEARLYGALTKTHVLLGLNTTELDYQQKTRRFNSALLIDPFGNDLKRYDKIHRVPFGEYVPFKEWLPFMNLFSPYDHDYSITSGDSLTRFQLGKTTFGVIVCYEDTDPYLARDFGIETKDGPAVNFLVNISNDGWFNGSAEHAEHLAISRFRAIEARRAVVRAVNMGISAAIDSNGRVLAPVKSKSKGQFEVWTIPSGSRPPALASGDWQQYAQVDGILVVDVPIDRRSSIYAAVGDVVPNSCWALIGVGVAWTWLRRSGGGRKPIAIQEPRTK